MKRKKLDATQTKKDKSSTLYVRDVPDKIKNQFKAWCAAHGITMHQQIIVALIKWDKTICELEMYLDAARKRCHNAETTIEKLREQIRHATEALEACYIPANPGSGAPLSVLATWAGNEIAELREQIRHAETAIKDLHNWVCSEAASWLGRNADRFFQMRRTLNKIEGVQCKLSQKPHSEDENNKLRKRVEELEAMLKTNTRVIEDDYS